MEEKESQGEFALALFVIRSSLLNVGCFGGRTISYSLLMDG
jgi:hypothetical protein